MRIVIDVQGTQSTSRLRGIGRYTRGLVGGLLRNRKEHDIHLVCNGLLPEGADQVHEYFGTMLPKSNIHVWSTVAPVAYRVEHTEKNREITSAIYTEFLRSINHDITLIASMMEGWADNFYCDIRELSKSIHVVCIVYDSLSYK